MPFPLGNHSKYSQRWLLVVVVSMKCFCKLKSEYCSTTQNCLFKILSLSAKHWWSKSTQRAKYDFSRELEKTLSEESRRERESVCKISFFREVKENFFQNLEFREENENFFFKILTFESISRNENSILQLEIEKNGPFPLEIENLVNACTQATCTLGYKTWSLSASNQHKPTTDHPFLHLLL